MRRENQSSRGHRGQHLLPSLNKQLIPTLQMQQSFHVLQLPIMELAIWLSDQILLNPALEKEDSPEEGYSFSSSSSEGEISLSKPKTLKELFLEQIQQTFIHPEESLLAEKIIESLDSKGLLQQEDAQRLSQHPLFEKVLSLLQRVFPYGVGARCLQESLLLQLECLNKKSSLAFTIVKDHYPLLLRGSVLLLAKALKVSLEELTHALQKDLRTLRLGTVFDDQPTASFRIPDITILYSDGKWEIDVHEETLPSFHIASSFLEKMKTCKEQMRPYLSQMLSSAEFIKSCIEKRHKTLKKIAAFLIEKQKAFLMGESSHLLPISLKEAAETLSCHPSTLARAIAHKTLCCTFGLIPLKTLFSHAIDEEKAQNVSQSSALLQLKKLIAEEDKRAPMSDSELLLALKRKGIHCARRTIAKYRSSLCIPSVAKRRRFSSS